MLQIYILTSKTQISFYIKISPQTPEKSTVKNPYGKKLKKTICINISESVLAYFKELAEKTNIPYQTLINMFLEQAKADKMEPKFVSKPTRKKQVA